MSAAQEFPLSKYFSCSNTNHFCLQTSFTGELGCITQGIFHVLYKLNFLKWNPPSSEENALIEPVSKITSCSTRRGLLHSGFEFFQSISPIPLFWPAAKAGEKASFPCHVWFDAWSLSQEYRSASLEVLNARHSCPAVSAIPSPQCTVVHCTAHRVFFSPLPADLGWIQTDLEAKWFHPRKNLIWTTSSDTTFRTAGVGNTLWMLSFRRCNALTHGNSSVQEPHHDGIWNSFYKSWLSTGKFLLGQNCDKAIQTPFVKSRKPFVMRNQLKNEAQDLIS